MNARKPVFFLFVVSLISLILSACLSGELSSDVNQDRIKTDYELAYDANRDVTSVGARFTFNGGALSLAEPSTVTFNSQRLIERAGVGSFYTLDLPGRIESGTFVWTNANGETFTNIVTLPTPVTLPTNTGPLSRSRTVEITWEGLPIQSNEYMALFPYREDATDFEITYASSDIVGATSLFVTPDLLSGVTPGPLSLSLTRVRDLPVTDGTSAGGNVRGRYVALDVTTQLVE
jgi:hypothetical protein